MPGSQIVIFGASGDLAARKLIPAIVGNLHDGTLQGTVQVVGVARSPKEPEAWRVELEAWLPKEHLVAWGRVREQIHYHAASILDAADLVRLRETLDILAAEVGESSSTVGRLFYLALKPTLFGPAIEGLEQAGLLSCDRGDAVAWRRVVVEKPFGRDLPSAQALNQKLLEHAREDQIFRIDHYLGKETVQNILALRFQNAIWEPLWNRDHIESVEISVCETVGMEGGRGRYYDHAGALRDMVQNHLLQVLALVAMEAPNSMAPDDVRSEKVRALAALRGFSAEDVAVDVVRGQYTASDVRPVGYLEEEGVPTDSSTETYVAIRAGIHNWRWNGVPFFLRTGKCLSKRKTEVILRFRTPPVDLLNGPTAAAACALRPNALHLLIQPSEGVRLGFLVKEPGPGLRLRHATLGFDYAAFGMPPTAPAYQRLLLDAIEGNATLFIRGDETETAWAFADAIRAGWAVDPPPPVYDYPAGSWGPREADDLFRGCEGTWGRGGVDVDQ